MTASRFATFLESFDVLARSAAGGQGCTCRSLRPASRAYLDHREPGSSSTVISRIDYFSFLKVESSALLGQPGQVIVQDASDSGKLKGILVTSIRKRRLFTCDSRRAGFTS